MDEIVIHDSKLVGRRLTSSVTVPKGLRKYFKSLTLFAYYDADITADRSILNIPLLSAVLPLAWLTGSDIIVDELDLNFKKGMDELKHEIMKMYPKVQFTTDISANVLIENRIEIIDTSERVALLFSGGVDSIYSLLKNIHLRPRLLMIWGVDHYPYPKHSEHWGKVISTYSEFAQMQGLTFHLIETNIGSILDVLRIEHDFHELLYDGGFRARLQHSLVLLPLAAPLSVGRFDRLLIAASFDPKRPRSRAQRAWASQPSTDENIVWANLKVKHDGYIPRTEKITGAIREYLKNDRLTLQVCFKFIPEREKLNCCACEKCSRTILALVLAGIDPNDCGFEMDNSTFQLIKEMLEKEGLTAVKREAEWEPMQMMISDNMDYNLYRSKEFFKWFRSIDLKSIEKNVWRYRDFYNKIPYPLSKYLDIFYRKMGIEIHDPSPIRPSALEKIKKR